MGLFDKSSSKSSSSVDQSTKNYQAGVDAGGALAQGGGVAAGAGAIAAQGSITVHQTDPGSFAFASDVVRSAFEASTRATNAAVTSSQSAALAAAGVAGDASRTVAELAAGQPVGIPWSKLAWPLAIAGVLIAFAVFRRKG